MRVVAAEVVAVHRAAAGVHAHLLAEGMRLSPVARGWFAGRRLRVSLVWRCRGRQVSHVMTVTLGLAAGRAGRTE